MPQLHSKLLPQMALLEPWRRHHRIQLAIMLSLALTVLFDWHFYNRDIGLTIPLSFIAVSVAAYLTRRQHTLSDINLRNATLILVFALLPSVEHASFLSFLLGLIGVMFFALLVNQAVRKDALAWGAALCSFAVRIPFRLARDLWLAKHAFMRERTGRDPFAFFRIAAMPILFAGVFLMIFQQANPILDNWVKHLSLERLYRYAPSTGRVIFWIASLSFSWAFLSVSRHLLRAKKTRPEAADAPSEGAIFLRKHSLNDKSVLLSLALFNGLFALQSLTDIYLLGNGHQLPAGYSFSEFAHQGAYALIVATLLAAGFMIAFDNGKSGKPMPILIKGLIYLWIGQNMLLVLFAMGRLQLYIDAYSLTHLRLWSLIWMGLVFIGLLLILIKLHRKQSTRWLINANLIATLLVLYGASIANFPLIIARYNVAVSRANPDKPLDFTYLAKLGEDALPALLEVQQNPPADYPTQRKIWFEGQNMTFKFWIQYYSQSVLEKQTDWRQWSFRRERLARTLPATESP